MCQPNQCITNRSLGTAKITTKGDNPEEKMLCKTTSSRRPSGDQYYSHLLSFAMKQSIQKLRRDVETITLAPLRVNYFHDVIKTMQEAQQRKNYTTEHSFYWFDEIFRTFVEEPDSPYALSQFLPDDTVKCFYSCQELYTEEKRRRRTTGAKLKKNASSKKPKRTRSAPKNAPKSDSLDQLVDEIAVAMAKAKEMMYSGQVRCHKDRQSALMGILGLMDRCYAEREMEEYLEVFHLFSTHFIDTDMSRVIPFDRDLVEQLTTAHKVYLGEFGDHNS
jgi:hypothetical protein